MKNDIELLEQFKKETGILLVPKFNDGFVFSGEYVIWLETELKKLRVADVIKNEVAVCDCGKLIDCPHSKCSKCLANETGL
jgi:hypothetical protein